jgi:hypothetical protein
MALYTQPKDADLLAPSELIALRGDKLSLSHPAEAAFVAAFLASEKAGTIRLEVRAEKIFFILWTREVLYAKKGANPCRCPEHCVESLLARLLDKKPAKVQNIVYSILKADASDPQEQALNIIRSGLTSRGLMEVQKVNFLKVFTRHEYKATERHRSKKRSGCRLDAQLQLFSTRQLAGHHQP